MTLDAMLENYKKFEEIKNAFIFMLKSESYKEIYHTINNLEWNFGVLSDAEIIRVCITNDFIIDIKHCTIENKPPVLCRIDIAIFYKEYTEQITIKDREAFKNIENVFDLFRLR